MGGTLSSRISGTLSPEYSARKFKDAPLPPYKTLRVVDEKFVTILYYEALLETHLLQHLLYSYIVFLTKDVKDLDDKELKELIRCYTTEPTEPSILRQVKYTCICFNFPAIDWNED